MKSPLCVCLNAKSINKISHLLILLRNTTPVEFVRKSRLIKDVNGKLQNLEIFYYTGPVVLQHKQTYMLFFTLYVAIAILARRNLYQEELINFAEALFHHFVKSFEILYGKRVYIA